MGKISHDRTWSSLTSYEHLRPVNITLFNIHTYFIPTPFPEKWRTYIRSLLHAYYVFIQNLLNFTFIHSLSHTINPACEKNSFTTHSIISTHTIVHFFALGLKQLSASTLTHILWYKLLLLAIYGDCKKIIKDLCIIWRYTSRLNDYYSWCR